MRKVVIPFLILSLLLGLLTPGTYAAGTNYWVKTYGGQNSDWFSSAVKLSDGSIVAVGGTESFGAGGTDAWIVKLSPEGKVIWAKTIGGRGYDWFNSVAETPNGDIVAAGVYGASSGNEFGNKD